MTVIPLTKETPAWPVRQADTKGEEPQEVKQQTLRFVIPQEFHSEEAWKSLKKNPGELFQEWIKADYRIDRAEIREESGHDA